MAPMAGKVAATDQEVHQQVEEPTTAATLERVLVSEPPGMAPAVLSADLGPASLPATQAVTTAAAPATAQAASPTSALAAATPAVATTLPDTTAWALEPDLTAAADPLVLALVLLDLTRSQPQDTGQGTATAALLAEAVMGTMLLELARALDKTSRAWEVARLTRAAPSAAAWAAEREPAVVTGPVGWRVTLAQAMALALALAQAQDTMASTALAVVLAVAQAQAMAAAQELGWDLRLALASMDMGTMAPTPQAIRRGQTMTPLVGWLMTEALCRS